MGFLNRIGSLFGSALQRVGQIHVHSVLNRVGQIASAGHKLISLANTVSGGAVRGASEAYLGKKATDAIAGTAGYIGRAYDTSLMTKAALGAGSSTQPRYASGGGTASDVYTKIQ